jgi:hypothetical protein
VAALYIQARRVCRDGRRIGEDFRGKPCAYHGRADFCADRPRGHAGWQLPVGHKPGSWPPMALVDSRVPLPRAGMPTDPSDTATQRASGALRRRCLPVNGRYTMTVDVPDGVRCVVQFFPSHDVYSWDAVSLDGQVVSTFDTGCGGGPGAATLIPSRSCDGSRDHPCLQERAWALEPRWRTAPTPTPPPTASSTRKFGDDSAVRNGQYGKRYWSSVDDNGDGR